MNKLPTAENENIVTQIWGDEVLIYNLATNRAFCLNETAAKVFESCDGATTFEDLKRKYQFTDELIYLALDNLKKEDLLAAEYVSPLAGLKRREAIRKIGLTTLIALPVIYTLTAPTSAQAASAIAACQPCVQPTDCASGRCAQVINSAARICNAGANGTNVNRPGAIFEIGNALICASYGEQFCCSGDGASFNQAANRCTCLPFF